MSRIQLGTGTQVLALLATLALALTTVASTAEADEATTSSTALSQGGDGTVILTEGTPGTVVVPLSGDIEALNPARLEVAGNVSNLDGDTSEVALSVALDGTDSEVALDDGDFALTEESVGQAIVDDESLEFGVGAPIGEYELELVVLEEQPRGFWQRLFGLAPSVEEVDVTGSLAFAVQPDGHDDAPDEGDNPDDPDEGDDGDEGGESARVSDGQVSLFEFAEGQGSLVGDQAGSSDLEIADSEAVSWTGDGLRVDGDTTISSDGAPAQLYDAVADSGEVTVEAWVTPDNLEQNGPARIVALSAASNRHNLLIGQGAYQGDSDLVEAREGRRDNGDYTAAQTPTGALTDTDPVHVVVTIADGTATVYVDGEQAAVDNGAGHPDDWDTDTPLTLASDADGGRNWHGTYHLVALYDTALDQHQIATNHTAGPNATTTPDDPNGDEPDPDDPDEGDDESARVSDGQVSLFEFAEGQGSQIGDQAGSSDLEIADSEAVSWTGDGLRVDGDTTISSDGAPAQLYDAVADSGEVTVEAWVTPDNLEQNGPARIVALSAASNRHNLLIGQGAYQGDSDLVEAREGRRDNGDYTAAQTPTGALTDTDPVHVVVTIADGTATVYVDGEQAAVDNGAGHPDDWDTDTPLTLASDADGGRNWHGTYHLVALYDTALDQHQIATNHTAGPNATTTPDDPNGDEPDPDDPDEGDDESARVSDGQVSLFEFAEGQGSQIGDQAGSSDLEVADADVVSWTGDGLRVDGDTTISSDGAPAQLYDAVADSGEVTVEAWVTPDNLEQNGPARIVALSAASNRHNLLIGQGAYQGDSDLVEAREGRRDNGDYTAAQTPTGALTDTDPVHVVVTIADGTATVYVDGEQAAVDNGAGHPDDWDTDTPLTLASDADGGRNWHGTYHLVALYDTALDQHQIATNHTAGPNATTTPDDPNGDEPDPDDPDEGDDGDDPDEGDEDGGSSPEPGDGEPASEVSRHGITWTFDDEYPVGRYANGDYWVQGPVDIVDIDPASQSSSGGRTINGSMINPSPEDGSSTGYGQTRDTGYDPSLNVADGVSTSDPLTVEPDSSLVSAISVDEDDARPGLERAAVLTVVDQPPPEDSFRPAYSSDDTTATHTTNDLDYDLLPDLDPVDGAPDPTDLASDFERVWLDHVPGWNGRAIHPTTNMPGYGRDMASKLGQGSLALMLDHPNEDKHDLLVNYVQIGIDFHGIVDNGGEENWVPNGGHAQGRKWPILFAGHLLDDPTMATIGDRDDVYFGEDAQTFHVTQTEIDREGNHADPDHRHYNPDYSDGYTQDMLGMPEWGQRHATDPNRDTPDPGRSYRQCCTAASWHGHVLSARLMDLQDAWNHDPLFDYSDRYLGETTDPAWPNLNPTGSNRFSDRPFTENMWHTHR
ncbi:LamG domain-containing protein [Egibacter rhizosphaerae]|uniref:LamG domain-containing protein n=1 Tax=Egibacter rhizosphaerae TaxID=1670831 RepID=UPI0013F171A3|nr:LamG domain-containing protein [Egibacter rhizosphaerae]